MINLNFCCHGFNQQKSIRKRYFNVNVSSKCLWHASVSDAHSKKTGTGLRFRKNKQPFLKNQWLHFTHQKISKFFLTCENKRQSPLLRWIWQSNWTVYDFHVRSTRGVYSRQTQTSKKEGRRTIVAPWASK